MPHWTFNLLLYGNLAGLLYGSFLFVWKRGAFHPLFEKDAEIRVRVNRRLGRVLLFLFSSFTLITVMVYALEWSEANLRALLLFEVTAVWAVEKYYGRVIKGMWEKKKGFYHGPLHGKCQWPHLVFAAILFLLAALFHWIAGYSISAGITLSGVIIILAVGRNLSRTFFPLFCKTALLTFIFLFLSITVKTGSSFLPLPLILILFLF
ncbi:hypothetical protein JXR74_04985 [Candidatus Mcinerneyibacteriota bacterium]|nr:hypothetical protein [Candidatus Mcinerneyibacteriota bacterium]